MGFRGGGKLTPPLSISQFLSTPEWIGLNKKIPSLSWEAAKVAAKAKQRTKIILKSIFRIFGETEPIDKIKFLL